MINEMRQGGTNDQNDRQCQLTHNDQMFLQRYSTLQLTEEHKVSNNRARTREWKQQSNKKIMYYETMIKPTHNGTKK